MTANKPTLLGFAAYSGTGKTTLLEKLIPMLKQHGLKVAVIKHAHHDFDIDQQGKDSYRLRKAGATDTLVASKYRWALIHEQEEIQEEPDLFELLTHIKPSNHDLILIEGFKHEAIPRIELHRSSLNKPYLYPKDKQIIAIATDFVKSDHKNLTVLDINNPEQITQFILTTLLPNKKRETNHD